MDAKQLDNDDDNGYESESSHPEDEEQFEGEEERDELKEVQKLAQHETTRVWVWKFILLITILCAAALVTAGTYRILDDEEEDDFVSSFDLFAGTVQDGLRFHLSNFHLATDTLANAIPGSAAAYQETFPYVTLGDFEALAQSARGSSGVEVLWWNPYVLPEQTELWTNYSKANADWWIQQSRTTALKAGAGTLSNSDYRDGPPAHHIWQSTSSAEITPVPNRSTFAPAWQQSPPPFANWVLNYDMMRLNRRRMPWTQAIEEFDPNVVFGPVHDVGYIANTGIKEEDHEKYHEDLIHFRKEDTNSSYEHPHCLFVHPVHKEVNDVESDMVGQVTGVVAWDAYLINLLPNGVKGITVVLENSCNQTFTYDLDGGSAFYRGAEDLHEPKYNHMRKEAPFHEFEDPGLAAETDGHCVYRFAIYPSETFEEEYRTNLPTVLAVVVGATFFVMIAFFFTYDWFVYRRNLKIVYAAARSNEIVSSMFPSQVRDQLLEQKNKGGKDRNPEKQDDQWVAGASPAQQTVNTIAEFYPSTTIMFADIVGFTAWSSVREPAQVFELLETLYAEFDDIAKQRRIFKVETVGDCYVACAGVPEPRKDHATAMARFSRDCLNGMDSLLKKLEVTLGPDTGDLRMRFGLHSGAVTAGVLRGDKARFQLFGDTMNTASRMESTGKPNMIQVSQDTADLLKGVGKGSWLSPREEMIEVKGKGLMVSYWLNGVSSKEDSSATESSGGGLGSGSGDGIDDAMTLPVAETRNDGLQTKVQRLVKWNVEVITGFLRLIKAQRDRDEDCEDTVSESSFGTNSGTVLDEVREVINLPSFNGQPCEDPGSVELDEEVLKQLHDFLSAIAALYNDNEFHNFEHASHVTMSLVKLLSRVVNPKIEVTDHEGKASMLHDCTYGITSDPLTQFACVFSAIIHDIDHPGVPNATLVKENSPLAQLYKKSVAEQNSFDIAWKLFMDDRYKDLRDTVCKGPSELKRFRQITVNLIMATDIMDKDLNGFRNQRWELAFGSNSTLEEAKKDRVDRKATIVIEHMIQASDVAHTMQHWHVYIKWNKRFFSETYGAYLSGRSEKDPSVNWYEGEIGFFDFYVIPLAKKLADCGVFGVSSSEYLDYAMRNRREWEDRGREVVAEMLEEAKAEHQRRMMAEPIQLTEETDDALMGQLGDEGELA